MQTVEEFDSIYDMSSDKSFYDYVLNDLFEGISGISSKSMFGGYGFYKDGVIFGMIANGKLYFKVGDSNKEDYEEYESKPFVYVHKGREIAMSYYELPADVIENKDELEDWIEKAYFASISSKKKK